MIGAFKVTIELNCVDACRLCRILQSDRKEYLSGIEHLEEIKEIDPSRKIGPRKQTPAQALAYTQKAVGTIEKVLDQLCEED